MFSVLGKSNNPPMFNIFNHINYIYKTIIELINAKFKGEKENTLQHLLFMYNLFF